MITYILTRFSIYDYDWKAFQANRNSATESEYREKLFNTDRLEYKFKSFELITLPSIINQTNQNFIWYIYVSEYLPEKYKERLLNLIKDYPNIKCLFIKSFKEFNKLDYENMKFKYCTIRLDDDDGLNNTFIEELNKYKNEENLTVISFPNGKKFTIEDNKIIYGENIRWENIALGLTIIGFDIFDCGVHTSIHTRYKIIYNEKPDMYSLNCNSSFCDSQRTMNWTYV